MALDMSVFEDILGDGLTDEYKTLLNGIYSPQQMDDPMAASASRYGFQPDRWNGVKSLDQLVADDNKSWDQQRLTAMLDSQKKQQNWYASEQARLKKEAELQKLANQNQFLGNQRAQNLHGQAGWNNYYSALQQEQNRQKFRDDPYANVPMSSVLKSAAMAYMGASPVAVAKAAGGGTGGTAQPQVFPRQPSTGSNQQQVLQQQQARAAALRAALQGRYGQQQQPQVLPRKVY
ncbi:hypothetical protein [Azospirillum sp. sgz301742]